MIRRAMSIIDLCHFNHHSFKQRGLISHADGILSGLMTYMPYDVT